MSRPHLPLPNSYHHQPYLPDNHGTPPNQPPGPNRPTYTKRGKITIVACVPCRNRKTKCDGKRPTCSQCQARDGSCHYNMTDDQRRLTWLRENVDNLAEEKSHLESLVLTMKEGSEQDAHEVLRRLRSGIDIQSLAAQVHAGRTLRNVGRESSSPATGSSAYTTTPSSRRKSSQSDVNDTLIRIMSTPGAPQSDEIAKRLQRQEDPATILSAVHNSTLLMPLTRSDSDVTELEGEYAQRGQRYGLVTGSTRQTPADTPGQAPDAHTPLQNQGWTSVTDDYEFVEHLLGIYFEWQHCFFQSFPEELFRQNFTTGQTKYCSRMLVNAICAAGCLLSERAEARRDPQAPRTAGADFFDEAVRLLPTIQGPSMPTTAALFILSHVEGSRGRLSSLWEYCGRSIRMALDLNLHLRSDRNATDRLSSEVELNEQARSHVFWGCFIADQITSFTLGRLPQVPINAVTVDFPAVIDREDEQPWGEEGRNQLKKPSYKSTTFRAVAALSKIVNSTLSIFFAPTQVMSGSLLLNEYRKYTSWYTGLPKAIAITGTAAPHIFCLHLYYHAAVLLLFRPFLKAKFTESDVSPREVCRQSANTISDIFAAHRRLYGTDGIFTFQVHCLLTACTIHLINLPTIASTNYLTAACNDFQDLVPRNEWATGSLNIIRGLAQKWKIILPQDVEAALYRNPDAAVAASTPSASTPGAFDFSADADSHAEIYRPEKRSATLPTHPGPSGSGSEGMMQKRQRLTPREKTPRGEHQQPTNYLFAPFPNQPAPLLGPIHTSTSSSADASALWNEELNKMARGFDGLNFSGDDWFVDPFMGYQGA